ncbi:MAG: RodZ domain-containing protein [Pseudomonadota bacterium]
MELRGFDSYTITLGDEMRGERASLGKSLEDVEQDLKIKIRMLTAIEACDLTGFPNQSVIAGYVRSYARYLGLDAEDCYQRFCDESGYRSPAAVLVESGADPGLGAQVAGHAMAAAGLGAQLASSRFAAPLSRNRFQARFSMGALTSSAALIALVAGLGYGGYALLQDIQRVGFAPLPEAPVVVADAPLISAPEISGGQVTRPAANDYADGGLLAAVALPTDLPPLEFSRRDGPISAIDPNESGIFAYRQDPAVEGFDSADDVIAAAEAMAARRAAEQKASDQVAEAAPEPVEKGVALIAAEKTWIRVRDGDRSILFEGTLNVGERFALPPRADAPVLRTGNAGGIFVVVDGVRYGPVGRRGAVLRDVSLAAASVRETMPETAVTVVTTTDGRGSEDRAEAALRSRP